MPVIEVKEAKSGNQKQEAQQSAKVDVRLMKPGKYEVTPETTFTVEIHLRKRGNRWVIVESSGNEVEDESVTFRMWGYDEMVEMRKMATTYDPVKRIHMIDHDALNQLKVQRLMVEWTFGRDNPRLKLWHVNGVLVDEAWAAFKKLQPNIISHILNEMNRIFEHNG